MSRSRLLFLIVVVVVVAAGLVLALRPDPIPVDVAEVRGGPMQATVAAEGVTRVREPYLVTAPISGTTRRMPVEVGDPVTRGETVVAMIEPAEPALLDARARAQAEAALGEATAAVHLAAANVGRAETELVHAVNQLERNRTLAGRGVIPQRALEESQQAVEAHRAALQAAQSELAMREATRARAEAQLIGPAAPGAAEEGGCCVDLTAPQSGAVLSVEQASARLVQAGEPLLTIGDLADLEIEVDLLSADAVRIAPGALATVERWGGEGALEARVRRIDPRGFQRVSALGIEEQRVRVHLDILSPAEGRGGLGDAFRVYVRIVTWEAADALQVPVSALFRADGEWAVYRIENGRAVRRTVAIGNRTQTEAEVLEGLEEGDVVVAFPGERLSDGVRVRSRDGA
jgi:HlyD family secretion protein